MAVLGPVPRGLPHLGLPALGWHDAAALTGTAVSLFVVILAQSAATSRAYAGKYEEAFSQDTDLAGLGAANVAAALSGAFVVNGSPTQTQVALLTAAAVVVLGVEEGIVLAVVASVIDHVRHTYHPFNSVLVKSPAERGALAAWPGPARRADRARARWCLLLDAIACLCRSAWLT